MTKGSIFIGTTDDDMVEFMRYVRGRGGEVVCTDYEGKAVQIIRGTKENETVELFNIDGVLGSVNVDADPGEGSTSN